MIGTPKASVETATVGQRVAVGLMRLVLFASVGVVGWTIGGATGGFAGAGLDMIFIGERTPDPGAAVAPFMWTLGMLGATGGMVISVMWLAIKMNRKAA